MTEAERNRLKAIVCRSCGARPVEGYADCQAMWEELVARTFSELPYARLHRSIVDAYSLQHPETFCISAKSYAAHLTGLCCRIEHDSDPRVYRAVQRWLNGRVEFKKPALPRERGQRTITHVMSAAETLEIGRCVEQWCQSVWIAYRDAHELARLWTRQALARHPER